MSTFNSSQSHGHYNLDPSARIRTHATDDNASPDGYYNIEVNAKLYSVRQLCLVKNRQWGEHDVKLEDRGFWEAEKPWWFKSLGIKQYPGGQVYYRYEITDAETDQRLAHPPIRPEDKTQSWDLFTCPASHKDLTEWELSTEGHLRVPPCPTGAFGNSLGAGGLGDTPMLSCFLGEGSDIFSSLDNSLKYKPMLQPLGSSFQHQTWRILPPDENWKTYSGLISFIVYTVFVGFFCAVVYFSGLFSIISVPTLVAEDGIL